MTPESIQTAGWLFFKIMIIVGIGLYSVFAGIIVRQEQLMSRVLEAATEPLLRLFVLLHLFASLGVLLAAIILL